MKVDTPIRICCTYTSIDIHIYIYNIISIHSIHSIHVGKNHSKSQQKQEKNGFRSI